VVLIPAPFLGQPPGEHSGAMRLIHNCLSDPCDATVAATGHQQS
jgi:hypothetical protein